MLFTANECVLNQKFTDAIVEAARVLDSAEDLLRQYSSWSEAERSRWNTLFAAFVKLRASCREPDGTAALKALQTMRTVLEEFLE